MKKLTVKTVFLLISGFLMPAAAFCQSGGDPANWCRNGLFPQEKTDFRIAKIKGRRGTKVFFYTDERDDCPSNRNCRTKSYLIPNDEVIVSREFKNYACAWFEPVKGSETVGWIALDSLEFVDLQTSFALNDWVGNWKSRDNSIAIAKAATEGLLSINGNAVWKGLGDNIHVGEIESEAAPQNNLLKIGENDQSEDCRVSMLRVGRFLIVADNLRCGGMNVSFSGVYRKK